MNPVGVACVKLSQTCRLYQLVITFILFCFCLSFILIYSGSFNIRYQIVQGMLLRGKSFWLENFAWYFPKIAKINFSEINPLQHCVAYLHHLKTENLYVHSKRMSPQKQLFLDSLFHHLLLICLTLVPPSNPHVTGQFTFFENLCTNYLWII